MKKSVSISRGAAVAALYILLTFLSSSVGLSSGAIQIRLSEALCVLPIFMPESVMGLTAGCLIASILIPGTVVADVIFGTLATLLGAVGTFAVSKKASFTFALIPPIVSNTLIIPFVLCFAYGIEKTLPYVFFTVGTGEFISVFIFGSLLYKQLKKTLFK